MKTLKKAAVGAAVFSIALGSAIAAPDHSQQDHGTGAAGASPDCMHDGKRQRRDHAKAHTERVEQHLSTLKSELKLNAGQETAWQTFEYAVRKQMAAQTHPKAPAADTDPMENRIARMEQRLAGMKVIAKARQDLYNVLNPDQKAIADRFFKNHQHT